MRSNDEAESDDVKSTSLFMTFGSLMVWGGIGVLILLFYAMGVTWRDSPTWHEESKALLFAAHAALIATGFWSVGGLVGFIFGIPRTLQEATNIVTVNAGGLAATSDVETSAGGYQSRPNTSLEQISDWLTKIIIGVGLTQLRDLTDRLNDLGEFFKDRLDGNSRLAIGLILTFLICGFFSGYLLTRLFLTRAFHIAETELQALKRSARKAETLAERGEFDKSIAAIERSLKQVSESTPKQLKKQLYESLVYNCLYLDPPKGFTKAIESGTAYVKEEPEAPSASIWTFLAAAYGQQYAWEAAKGRRDDVMHEARDKALDATRRAISLDSAKIGLLQTLWDPKDPRKLSPEENDLESFFDDPEFQAVLGPPNPPVG